MSTQPPNQPPRPVSQDGKWEWDGKNWQPRQQPKRNSHKLRNIVIALATLVLLITVVSLANAGTNKSVQTSATPTPTAKPASAPAVAATKAPAATNQKDGGCGPTPCANHNYGQIVYVTDAAWNPQDLGTPQTPENGNVFVVMKIRFENRLETEMHANPSSFVLQDSAGIKHTWKPLLSGDCADWQPVNLAKGGQFGPKCIAFEAKASSDPHGLTLVWSPALGYDYKIPLG